MQKSFITELESQGYIAPVARIITARLQGLICTSPSTEIVDFDDDDDPINM